MTSFYFAIPLRQNVAPRLQWEMSFCCVRWRFQVGADGSVGDLFVGGAELGHFGRGAYGDADVGRPGGPNASDVDVALLHCVLDGVAVAAGVEHEAVAL